MSCGGAPFRTPPALTFSGLRLARSPDRTIDEADRYEAAPAGGMPLGSLAALAEPFSRVWSAT